MWSELHGVLNDTMVIASGEWNRKLVEAGPSVEAARFPVGKYLSGCGWLVPKRGFVWDVPD